MWQVWDGKTGLTLELPFRIVLPPPGVKDFSDWNQAGGMCPAKFWDEAAAAFWQGPYTKGEPAPAIGKETP